MAGQKNRTADPNKTKAGRPRLGPLNYTQLERLLSQSSKPKEKSKIQRRMQTLAQCGQVPKPVAESAAE